MKRAKRLTLFICVHIICLQLCMVEGSIIHICTYLLLQYNHQIPSLYKSQCERRGDKGNKGILMLIPLTHSHSTQTRLKIVNRYDAIEDHQDCLIHPSPNVNMRAEQNVIHRSIDTQSMLHIYFSNQGTMLARHPISILRENFPFQLLRKLAKGW